MPYTAYPYRSALFVPGNRPERFAKAVASGADMVIIDLEDAVAAADKVTAREAALDFVESDAATIPTALRLNPVSTLAGLEDLVDLGREGCAASHLFFPKVEHVVELEIAAAALGKATDARFVPLIETPKGLAHAAAIAAHPRVAAIMLGGADLSAELGITMSWDGLLAARGQLALAAAHYTKGLIDVPWVHLKDADGLRTETVKVRALGFTAKAAIHPDQVAAINAVFTPTPADVAAAQAAFAALPDGGVTQLDGELVEAPFLKRHARVMTLARRFGLIEE
jgi:(S)-citramalyl-CoA lyase